LSTDGVFMLVYHWSCPCRRLSASRASCWLCYYPTVSTL